VARLLLEATHDAARPQRRIDERLVLDPDLDDPGPAGTATDTPDVREAAPLDAAEDEQVGCACGSRDLRSRGARPGCRTRFGLRRHEAGIDGWRTSLERHPSPAFGEGTELRIGAERSDPPPDPAHDADKTDDREDRDDHEQKYQPADEDAPPIPGPPPIGSR
jgi:hypothetical protein